MPVVSTLNFFTGLQKECGKNQQGAHSEKRSQTNQPLAGIQFSNVYLVLAQES